MFWYKLKSNIKFVILGIVTLLVVVAGIIFFSYSCSNKGFSKDNISTEGYEELGSINLCIVYSNRNNSLAVPNGEEIGKYSMAALRCGGSLIYVRADGNPEIVNSDQNFKVSEYENKDNKDRQDVSTLQKYYDFILDNNNSNAKYEEADIYQAITKAASNLPSVKDKKDRKNYIIVIDSGISTAGRINLNDSSFLNADPDDIRNIKSLPSLDNIDNVEWFGFNQVCGEQKSIPTDYPIFERIKNIYTNFLTAAGVGCVNFNTSVNGRYENDKSSLPKVSAVNFGTFDSGQWDNVILGDAVLAFKGDSAEFVDENSALNVLNNLANQLKENKSIHITINGYIASQNGDSGNLSQRRADKVKNELISRGVSSDQITSVGKGPGPFPYLDKYNHINAANRYIEIIKD